MKPKRTWDAFIVALIGIGILLMGAGAVIFGGIIACAGVLMLVWRNDYILAGISAVAVLVVLYIAYLYSDLLLIFSQISTLILSLIFIKDAYYTHRVKKALEKIMKSQNSSTKELRIEILSFDVCEYYTRHYHFETPIRVRIWANVEVIKGIFDVKKNKFVVEEPVMFPVYTRIPEKVWNHIVSIHNDGTPKRVEFTDKYEGLVGVDVYDEVGSRTEESWRLKKSLYEKWNPVKREWEPQPRGWAPKKSVRERLLG